MQSYQNSINKLKEAFSRRISDPTMISRIMIPIDQRSQNGEESGILLKLMKPIDEYGLRTPTSREAVVFL